MKKIKDYDGKPIVPEGKTTKAGIALHRLEQIGFDEYRNVYKIVYVEIPDDGYKWSVIGATEADEQEDAE